MISDTHSAWRRRIPIHFWTAVSFSGFYCALPAGKAFTIPGIVACLGIAVIGVLFTLAAMRKQLGASSIAEAVERYVDVSYRPKRGWAAAAATIGPMFLLLGVAALFGLERSPLASTVAEALRNAAFLMAGLYVWRLRPAPAFFTVLCWVCADLSAFYFVGYKVELFGSFLLVGTALIGFLALVAQDVLTPTLPLANSPA